MEGFRDIFWQGDSVVWGNFFRHYLLCLEWAYSIVAIGGEAEPLSWENIPFANVHEMSFTPQYQERIQKLTASFREEEMVKFIVESLGQRLVPVRRDELSAYLQPIHTLALSLIKKNYLEYSLDREKNFDPNTDDYFRKISDQLKLMFQHAERLTKEIPDAETLVPLFFKANSHSVEQFRFLHRYNNSSQPFEANRNFVLFDFPNEYIRRLETLIYPDWYVACFMKDCRDSSVWGSYGDSHTAACLIFRVGNADTASSLRLRRISGYGSDGPHVDFVAHHFKEVVYENAHLPVDFFRSLGRLPMSDLLKAWYVNDAGHRSTCADEIFTDEEAWKERYWNSFYHGVTRKLDAWQHEKEMRLLLSGMIFDFSNPSSRVAKYAFDDLEGIIFGINTPIDKKIEIGKIIEEKCRAEGRKDFKFYQAFYSQEKGTIEHAELSLLKFDMH